VGWGGGVGGGCLVGVFFGGVGFFWWFSGWGGLGMFLFGVLGGSGWCGGVCGGLGSWRTRDAAPAPTPLFDAWRRE